jgi:DnaD/phage-associated family protein
MNEAAFAADKDTSVVNGTVSVANNDNSAMNEAAFAADKTTSVVNEVAFTADKDTSVVNGTVSAVNEAVSVANKNTSVVNGAVSAANEAASDLSVSRPLPEKPVITPELLRKAKSDEACSDILFEVEAYFGKTLSQTETGKILYIYDQLGFSAELIEYLIEYCIDRKAANCRYAEKVAMKWYEKGIDTVAKAKADSRLENLCMKVYKELGINQMVPTNSASAFIDSWVDEMGFSEDVILYACRKTYLQIPQSANFAYVNSILDNWHKNGVKSLKEAQALDMKHQKDKSARKSQAGSYVNPNGFAAYKQADSSKELSDLEKLLSDELNGGLRKTGN